MKTAQAKSLLETQLQSGSCIVKGDDIFRARTTKLNRRYFLLCPQHPGLEAKREIIHTYQKASDFVFHMRHGEVMEKHEASYLVQFFPFESA